MIRVILISSVSPNQSSAGQVILHRHVVDQPEINLKIMKTEPSRPSLRKFIRRVMGCMSKTKMNRFYGDLMALWQGGWIDAELPAPDVLCNMPTVVMTVAHQDACYAAARYARRYDLPLVTFFHDWWPDIANVHRPFKRVLNRLFQDLYSKSDLALCVSEGMKTKLGSHPSAKVLLPIPAKRNHKVSDDSPDKDNAFRLLYAGNLTEYGPMLMEALELLKDRSNIRLEVRGNSSSWPDTLRDEMTKRGMLLPFVPREELTEWLESADAFLVTQSFDDKQKGAMITNFPSKLSEFAQYGKPLIIWAPDYASGTIWAREESRALVVDHGDPQYLLRAAERLCDDKDEFVRLMQASQTVASGCFDPERIQSDFLRWVKEVAVSTNQKTY